MKIKNILLTVFVLFFQNNILFGEISLGQSTWSILSSVRQTINDYPGCDVPRIEISDPGSGNTHTISAPGNYIVVEDFVNGQIVITADDVDIDLNGREIAADVGLADPIILLSGVRKNVSIYNGYVTETSVNKHGYGIQVSASSSTIQLKNLTVSGCSRGIFLDGSSGNEVVGCNIDRCSLVESDYGIYFDYASNNFVSNCQVIDIEYSGVYIAYFSNYNYFSDCYVLNVGVVMFPYGIIVDDDCVGNSFVRCVVKNIQSLDGFANATAIFLGLVSKNNIIDCLVSDVDSPSGNRTGIWVSSSTDNCVLRNNILMNCGTAIRGIDSDAFGVDGNLAIQNLSFNNNESAADYNNVPNVDNYNVLDADDIGRMENSYVVWTT